MSENVSMFLIILFSAILTDNFVLSKFMGICPFLGVSKKIESALGMSGAVIFVMLLATAMTYPIYTFFLEPNGLEYLNTMAFILVIALFVQLVEILLKRYMKALYQSLGVYLPLITTNCAVLGVTLLNVDNQYNFAQSMVNALGAGIGFTLALLLFAGVRERLDTADVPDGFKGIPITLVAASIVSLAFMGFGGLVTGLFS